MCSRDSGSKVKIWLRDRSGVLIAKNGFCVVAPIRMTMPSSTSGSSTSCCARLKRWISSTNRMVRSPSVFQVLAGLGEDLADLLDAGRDRR